MVIPILILCSKALSNSISSIFSRFEISKLENVSTVGINCIEPPLVAEAIRKLKKYSTKKVLIYPNSGELYNSNTKEWTGQKKLSKTHIKEWLKLSPDIIGGCCRVGTNIIKEINNQINI